MDEIDAATKSWRKWVLGRGKGSIQEAGKVKTLILYALNWWEQVKNGGRATSWEVNGEVVVLEREEEVLAWTRAKTQDEGKWSGQIYLGGSSNRTRWIGGEGQESRWLLVSDFSNGMVEPLQKKIRKNQELALGHQHPHRYLIHLIMWPLGFLTSPPVIIVSTWPRPLIPLCVFSRTLNYLQNLTTPPTLPAQLLRFNHVLKSLSYKHSYLTYPLPLPHFPGEPNLPALVGRKNKPCWGVIH